MLRNGFKFLLKTTLKIATGTVAVAVEVNLWQLKTKVVIRT